jgi:hypothetical protein
MNSLGENVLALLGIADTLWCVVLTLVVARSASVDVRRVERELGADFTRMALEFARQRLAKDHDARPMT